MLWRAPWLRHRLVLIAFAAWDVTALYLSYNLVFLARIGKWEGVSFGLGVISGTWLGISYLLGRYSPPAGKEQNRWATQLTKTILAGSAVVAVFICHSWIYQVVDAQTRFRGFLIPFTISSCVLSTLGLAVKTNATEQRRRWVVVGNASERETLRKELAEEEKGLKDRSFFATTDQISGWISKSPGSPVGIAVGSLGENAGTDTERLLRFREAGERVIPLLSWCEQELQRIPPELVKSEWLIHAEGFSLRPGRISWRIKRFGDIIGSVVLVVITAPIIVVAGMLVWLEDQGPVFYGQIRSGLYGKPIRIWKLRSMKVNAETNGAQWASNADPRITRIGRLIRATRIDELPQLFSVLAGDLSLIGPRPERPELERDLEILIPNYRIRHWIRPGLSGWAQVCYPYGASTEDSRMKLSYDLYYLRNASFLLDFLITMKTIRLILRASGASPSQGIR